MRPAQSRSPARRGFTLVQIVVVIAIIGVLTTLLVGVLGRGRRTAMRSQCDVHLKAVVMALDAYRQETGAYPTALSMVQKAGYVRDANLLHCPRDPDPAGTYEDFYVFRTVRPDAKDTRDQSTLPLLVCPLHEEDSGTGVQAFTGGTKQFAASPAVVTSTSGASITRPGKDSEPARVGMTLRGGDRIQTNSGSAVIEFADRSTATMQANSDITVLQSYIVQNTSAPLYTLIRQRLGEVAYKVTPGSKFDVVTPTATAGALGTDFLVKRDGDSWYLKVTESKVLCATPSGSTIYEVTQGINPGSGGWEFIGTEGDRDRGGIGDDNNRP